MSLQNLGKHEPQKWRLFSHAVYCVLKTTLLWLAISLLYMISVSAVHFHPRFDGRSTAQCSPVLRQQRTPPTTRRTLADNTAGVQERCRCRATSHCSVRRRDRSASWLATLQWTLFRPRRRLSRQHVPGTSEAAAAVSFSTHGIQHDWKDAISGVHVSPGSAETLLRRGEIANQHLKAYYLSNISAENYQNRLMCVEVIVCYISVVFETHCTSSRLQDKPALNTLTLSATDPCCS